jgi:hypothetical protein
MATNVILSNKGRQEPDEDKMHPLGEDQVV